MEDLKQAELDSLKTRADLLGIDYHPSIGAAKLREKIAEHEAKGQNSNAGAGDNDEATPKKETKNEKTRRMIEEATKLVRISLTCMNPAKKDWNGELIGTGNGVVGTIKRFIPFNAQEKGWHVEQILLNVLKARQFPHFYTEKTKHGVDVRRSKLIKEFAIEILPPLTQEELDDLARQQAMAAGQVG